MLPQPARRDRRGHPTLLTVIACVSAFLVAAGCDKVPLLAPTGSVITLFPSATMVPADGQIEIVATVIEQGVAAAPPTGEPPAPGAGGGTTTTSAAGSGTPVHNGTLVTFTTTIGRIEPGEARTHNGQVRVKFIAAGQSGVATVTAFSGGASGRLENLRVGTAAAERVIVTAAPQTLGPAGGTTDVLARVEDVSGVGLPGVPVQFTANAGQLSPSTATTDQDGVARTRLTTTRETTVTANVAGKTAEVTVGLNPRTGISITAPATPVSAGQPATFTVNVGSTANIREVVVDFGDGARQSLGALSGSTTVQHTYQEAATYTVRATAVEASGFSEEVSTRLAVLPGQPPSVIVIASNSNPGRNEQVILTAQVSGATSTIIRYEWNFGEGAIPPTAVGTGNRAQAAWTTQGTKVITVRVIQATGPEGEGFGTVNVGP